MMKKISSGTKPSSDASFYCYYAVAAIILSVFLSGCLATSKEIVELRDDINQLRVKLNEVQINQADLTEKMSSMDLSMSALGEKLEENKNVMSLVANRLDDIESGLSSKFSRLESRMDAGFKRISSSSADESARRSGVAPSETENTSQENVAVSTAVVSPSQKDSQPSGVLTSTPAVPTDFSKLPVDSATVSPQVEVPAAGDITPGALYRMAYDDFTAGRYESATATFKVFLEKYPNASLAPYARYYMGESRYARSLLDGALEDFEYVIKNYPRSDVLLAALYKKALVLERMNRPEDAKKVYSEIIRKYPSTQEAAMSAERLKGYQPDAGSNKPATPLKRQGEKE